MKCNFPASTTTKPHSVGPWRSRGLPARTLSLKPISAEVISQMSAAVGPFSIESLLVASNTDACMIQTVDQVSLFLLEPSALFH